MYTFRIWFILINISISSYIYLPSNAIYLYSLMTRSSPYTNRPHFHSSVVGLIY